MPGETASTNASQSASARKESAAELEKFRRDVAVLFTNVRGSVAYFARFGDVAGTEMVQQTNHALAAVTSNYGGQVIKTMGDSLLAVFGDSRTAAAAAVEMQKTVAAANTARPEEERVVISIGLNYGTAIVKSDDVFGDVVNVASRLESVSGRQQIVISESVKQQLESDAPFKIRYLGKFVLRGREENRDLYELVWSDEQDKSPVPTHTQLTYVPDFAIVPKFKLQHVRRDGSVGEEFEFIGDHLSFGRTEGDLMFSTDAAMAPLHGRLFVQGCQPFVEEAGEGLVFYSIIGAYMLQDRDVVKIGSQLLEFHADTNAISQAAASGISLTDLGSKIATFVAEFVSIRDRSMHYPLGQMETTWGRTKGTCTFPDDLLMSATHARVYHRGENFFLEDLDSRNGTFVRARGKVPVPPGTIIFAGGQLLKVALA